MILSGVPIIGSQDLVANQPDPADVPDGYVFFATDTTTYYVQFGGAWFTIGGGGGGGSTAREKLTGSAVTIPAGTDALLTFDSSSGDTVVDLTDPSHPAIIDSGVYVVGLYVGETTPMIPADSYLSILSLDAAGENAQIAGTTTVGADSFPNGPLTLAYYIVAGGTITLDVFNQSLTNDYDFNVASCVIQRIS